MRLYLKEHAEARGLNKHQLALRTGLNANVIRRYWNNTSTGKKTGPRLLEFRIDFIERLAQALGVAAEDLFSPPRTTTPPSSTPE